jgi:hypothetical protein
MALYASQSPGAARCLAPCLRSKLSNTIFGRGPPKKQNTRSVVNDQPAGVFRFAQRWDQPLWVLIRIITAKASISNTGIVGIGIWRIIFFIALSGPDIVNAGCRVEITIGNNAFLARWRQESGWSASSAGSKLLVLVSSNQMDASVIHVVDTEHRAGVWIKGGV